MSAPTTRGAAIAAYCRQCIHDSAAFGTWREQVATCTACDCPLWRFRPVQDGSSCPDWIKSRDPADLPDGWAKLEQPAAVRAMRASIADKAKGRAVRPDGETRAPDPHPYPSRDTAGAQTHGFSMHGSEHAGT